MKQKCRVCWQDAKCTLEIYDKNLNIAEILQLHLPFEFSDSSTVICTNCWYQVNSFHQFYLTVQETQSSNWHEALIDEDVKFDCNPLYEPEVAEVSATTERVTLSISDTLQITCNEDTVDNVEVEAEYVDDSADNDDNDEDNDEDIDDDNDEDYCPADDDDAEDSNDVKYMAKSNAGNETNNVGKNEKIGITCVDPDNKDVNVKCLRKRKYVSKSEASEKKEVKPVKRKQTTKSQQIRPDCDLTDTQILQKHIGMLCDICLYVGETFAELCHHMEQEHSVKPYVVCCGRKIKKHHRLLQHAYKHEDPNLYKCERCEKVFFDAYSLKSHNISNHPPEGELKFKCDKCDRKFSRQHLLNIHTPSHIPPEERTFVCRKCPDKKLFGSNRLLQIHVSMCHKKIHHICHVCAKEIRDTQAFKKHVRLHFEDSGPRVKCPQPGCDRWLKDKDNLKQHLRRHNIEGKIYECPECGKKCKNRSALTGHLRYAHTDSEFVCDVCKKSFKKAITLKEHMAQHTGESLYKCPFCTRTFNSSANMHSHKKRMHPIEWEMWRKTKRGNSQHDGSNQHVLQLLANNNTKHITN